MPLFLIILWWHADRLLHPNQTWDMAITSNPPTDSTDFRVTMQHKSGTALIWRDMGVSSLSTLLFP